jgi:m7GpppX diphosphatase
MEKIVNNQKFIFIPNNVISFENLLKEELIMKNDIHEKYICSTPVKGELIICNDITKLRQINHKIKRETYNEYLEFIKNYDFKKDNWIYNIIDGISEQDLILYRDELCIVIPSFTFDGKNTQKLHILCIAVDKSLRCLRDLESKHISLLEHMKNKTISIISSKYNIYDSIPFSESDLKIYIHYEPSTYQLHIHFVNNQYTDSTSSVEYSHEINSVIYNLNLDNNYYKNIILNKH